MISVPLQMFAELKKGRSIYAELEPSRPDLRAWVMVFMREDRLPRREETRGPFRYLVYKFEVKAEYVAKNLDIAGEELNEERHEVYGLSALDQLLLGMVGDLELWQTAMESDCPL